MAVFFDASPDVLTPEVLAGLGDDQLWQVIYDNLHPGKDTPGAWEALVAPEVVDRVRRLLTARHVDIEHQLAERGAELAEFRHQCWEAGPAGRQAWFDREAEHNRWRGRALDVKRSIAYRLQVAKATAGAMGQQRVARSAAPTGAPPAGSRSRSTGTGRSVSRRGSTRSRTTKRCGRFFARSGCRRGASWSPPPTCSPTACGRECSAGADAAGYRPARHPDHGPTTRRRARRPAPCQRFPDAHPARRSSRYSAGWIRSTDDAAPAVAGLAAAINGR